MPAAVIAGTLAVAVAMLGAAAVLAVLAAEVTEVIRLVACESPNLSLLTRHHADESPSCGMSGHFARDCSDAPAGGGGGGGGGLTGECYNCGEVGHNKADCTKPRVDRPFTGTCNSCGVEGHAARDCPSQKCKLCDQEGHKAIACKSRRIVDWTGVPELELPSAWTALIDAAASKDLDVFRTCLRAYARASIEVFRLPDVEMALREAKLGVYLIAKPQDIAANMTIVDLVGNPDREFVLSIQLSAKPRRAKMAQGWPETPEENIQRLASAGFVQDCGVPLCGNCGELGHTRKVHLGFMPRCQV